MRHFIKYFLIILITFWLVGFWYILFQRNSSRKNRNNDDSEQEDLGYDLKEATKDVLIERLRRAERKLNELEDKNLKNEQVISQLKYESIFLGFVFFS